MPEGPLKWWLLPVSAITGIRNSPTVRIPSWASTKLDVIFSPPTVSGNSPNALTKEPSREARTSSLENTYSPS